MKTDTSNIRGIFVGRLIANKLTIAVMLCLLSLPHQVNAQSWQKVAPCVDYSNPSAHVHVVKADLTCEGLRLVGTEEDQRGTTTTSFAQASGVTIAVNGDFFSTTLYPLGLTITNSAIWTNSRDRTGRSFIACTSSNVCTIDPPDNLAISNPEWSIAVGGLQTYSNGAFICPSSASSDCSSNMNLKHPRTAIGMDANNRMLFIIVVEGRISGFEGMTLSEVSLVFKEIGVSEGLNLDGGGSSTLVIRGKRINALPTGESERIVANHFGIKAPPIRGRRF